MRVGVGVAIAQAVSAAEAAAGCHRRERRRRGEVGHDGCCECSALLSLVLLARTWQKRSSASEAAAVCACSCRLCSLIARRVELRQRTV